MNVPTSALRTPVTTRIFRHPTTRFVLCLISATVVLAFAVEALYPGAPMWLVGGAAGAMGYLLRHSTRSSVPGRDGTIEEAPAS